MAHGYVWETIVTRKKGVQIVANNVSVAQSANEITNSQNGWKTTFINLWISISKFKSYEMQSTNTWYVTEQWSQETCLLW